MQTASVRPETGPIETLGDLPVRLEFIAGTTVLTAADLGDLGAGSVIALEGSGTGGAVDICVEGRVIGHGEMVSIGGRLGIEIKDFARGYRMPGTATNG